MQDSLIHQGFDLMFFGMGMVVIFLAILVLATFTMSWLIRHFFPEQELPAILSASSDPEAAYPDARVLAVIKEAIKQHRARRN